MSWDELKKYSQYEILEVLLRFKEDYPACYKAFFFDELKKIHGEPMNPYSPFHRTFQKVSEEDMEYLRGKPAPLMITIPITIEKDEEDS